MKLSTSKVLTFSILVEKNHDVFVAHSLETGIVAVANDESDVLAKIGKMIERQVAFALSNDRLADIFHPAPREIWSKWQQLQEPTISRTEKPLRGPSIPGFIINQTAYAAAC